MGNPDARAAAKKRKEERVRFKDQLRLGGRISTKRSGTQRKHIQGNNSSNDQTKDPRVK